MWQFDKIWGIAAYEYELCVVLDAQDNRKHNFKAGCLAGKPILSMHKKYISYGYLVNSNTQSEYEDCVYCIKITYYISRLKASFTAVAVEFFEWLSMASPAHKSSLQFVQVWFTYWTRVLGRQELVQLSSPMLSTIAMKK